MIIMFVRHAEAKDNGKLTRRGKKQCKIATSQKETIEFSQIYTSISERCIQTARLFQLKMRLPVTVLEGMYDRQLLTSEEATTEKEKEWLDNYMNPLYSSTEPEGCKEFLARNFVCFKSIIEENKEENKNVVLIGHSATLYALLAYLNGIKKNSDIPWVRAGNCSKIYFEIV